MSTILPFIDSGFGPPPPLFHHTHVKTRRRVPPQPVDAISAAICFSVGYTLHLFGSKKRFLINMNLKIFAPTTLAPLPDPLLKAA
jgi:hypothetical protein